MRTGFGVAHAVPQWSEWLSRGWETYLPTSHGRLYRIVVANNEVLVYTAGSTSALGILKAEGTNWEPIRIDDHWHLRVTNAKGETVFQSSPVINDRAYTPHL